MTRTRVRRRRGRMGTLRFRISAVAVCAVVLVLTAASVAIVLAQRAALLADLDEGLSRQADAVVTRLATGAAVRRADLLFDDAAVLVSGPDGDAVVGAPSLIEAVFRYGPTPPHTAFRTVAIPGPDGAARVLSREMGDTTIWVAAPTDEIRDSTAALVRALLIAVPASAAVLALLVWWVVGRTLRPVENIRAEVEQISGRQLERRVPEPGTSDEISRLAHTMNAMLDRLQGSADRQRRFVADASHELRSPLARIRTELEVDRAHPESADPAATAASVLAETIGLQRMVDDLLLLARGDAGALGGGRADVVDLDDVVQGQAAARRSAGGPRIDTRGVVPAQVRGSGRELERLVGNLLDNAVRHARSRVAVSVTEDGGSVVLAVADDGPGIPAGAEEAVFERFTRLDDARSAADGGVGLGLAIARDIAVRHGGTLTVDRTHRPGARFLLTLPGDGVCAAPMSGRSRTTEFPSRGESVASVQETVDVDVPIRVAYDQWTQFESFPQFMGGVERITQVDDTHTHWVTSIDGVTREFDAEITEQHPDERVAWTSTSGETRHAGVVTFHRLDEDKTRVMIQIDWQPEGLVEKAGAALGFDDRQVKADAKRFKEFIESRGAQTGAWRGDVERPA